MDIDREIANMQGATALPRKNGELIFYEPWEGRVFGMAITLHGEVELVTPPSVRLQETD